MRQTLKKYFIPQAENNYNPHILHTKRAVFYGALFVGVKILVVGAITLLPLRAFVTPDVLSGEGRKIIALVNGLRVQKDLPPLAEAALLNDSSQAKAGDMATDKYFSHTSPQGLGLSDFLTRVSYDYTAAGENLAMGFSDGAEVVNGWLKSPTHYANLVDSGWREFGVGLEGGEYEGLPTVYVAQHYGAPAAAASITEEARRLAGGDGLAAAGAPRPKTKAAARGKPKPAKSVAGIRETKPEVEFIRAQSKIFWSEEGESTTLSVRAEINGPVRSATVLVNNYPIELRRQSGNLYHGELTVAERADNFFRVVLAPTITITAQNGTAVKDNIDWSAIKIVSQTPWQKYLRAKGLLANILPIFSASRWLYVIFMAFFSAALALNIFIEIRKQHPRIILQTIALLVLLLGLWKF